MKKILAIIMSTMVALSMLPAMAFAAEGDSEATAQTASDTSANEEQAVSEDEDIDDIDAEDLEDGEWTFNVVAGKAIITGYSYAEESPTITIPSTVKDTNYDEDNSFPVIGIADEVCIGLESCTKLIIPASITSIGKEAFDDLDHQGIDNTKLVVDCQCGSTAEKWALANRYNTTNGVTKTVKTKATFTQNGAVVTTCKKCGASGTYIVDKFETLGLYGNIFEGHGYAFYTGKNIKPQVAGGPEGEYTLSGPTAKKIGKYSYTLTLKGWYSGTKTLSLQVVPKSTPIKKLSKGKKSFTVKWKKQKTQTTGYQVRYSTNYAMKKAKTVTVKGNKKTSKKIKKLKAKKTYYVQVRTYKTVKGKKYALPWGMHATKKVKTK